MEKETKPLAPRKHVSLTRQTFSSRSFGDTSLPTIPNAFVFSWESVFSLLLFVWQKSSFFVTVKEHSVHSRIVCSQKTFVGIAGERSSPRVYLRLPVRLNQSYFYARLPNATLLFSHNRVFNNSSRSSSSFRRYVACVEIPDRSSINLPKRFNLF